MITQNAAANPAQAQLLAAADEALALLENRSMSDERVHDVRKALKKARAALRLLQPAFAVADYRTENLALRDSGRSLSPLRDARSLLEAIAVMRTKQTSVVGAAALTQIEQFARTRLIEARRELSRTVTRRHCAKLVAASRARIVAKAELEHATEATLREGLAAIYRKGRKAFMQASKKPTAEMLHELRKQTKYLHIAATVMQSAGAYRLGKTIKRADLIGNWLGDDRDLGVLREAAHDLDVVTDHVLIDAIESRKSKLRKRAFARAAKLYARTPRRWLARLGNTSGVPAENPPADA
jgi:CHAD domain-containing protein